MSNLTFQTPTGFGVGLELTERQTWAITATVGFCLVIFTTSYLTNK